MAAAIQLAHGILHGGKKERDAYFTFLKAGCSRDVLDIMKSAGVDLTSPKPVQTALDYFARIVGELKAD